MLTTFFLKNLDESVDFRVTLDALAQLLPQLAADGIAFVFASELVS